MTVTIGLSGGIGSGKSTVGALLQKLGATLVDADAIVHELQAPGSPMLQEIAAAFGPEVIDADGALDRPGLAERVFGDSAQRVKLGQIMHGPVIAEMMRRATEARRAGDALVVLDIPLLFEGAKTGTGTASRMDFDATVAVWVPEAVQLERTLARDDCSREQALQRIRAQLPIDEKREMADYVIDNSGSRESTEAQVRALFEELVARE
ncbi:MAG: dephospho-CoA kinase [Myxococcota bacterium]